MKTEVQEKETGLWVRDSSNVMWKKYLTDWKPLRDINISGKLVLDIGAYIGAFTKYTLDFLNPKNVICIEPDPDSLYLLKKNFKTNTCVTILEGVVTSNNLSTKPKTLITVDEPGYCNIYLGRNKSTNCIMPVNGRECIRVKAFDFKELLKKFKPSLIKCDIEGAEFTLDWSKLDSYVTSLMIEIHQNPKVWTLDKQVELDKQLQSQGFKPLRKITHRILYTRNTQFYYQR
jgi:FkbM family methyltransferase